MLKKTIRLALRPDHPCAPQNAEQVFDELDREIRRVVGDKTQQPKPH